MKLCMFHPLEHPMERGWPGRVDGTHVVQLAAQTLEAYFTGGGTAREHAVYPLDGVRLLAPVLHPPAVRVFEDETAFAFANPAAIVGPDATIPGDGAVTLLPRIAAVIGAGGAIGGCTGFAEWRRPDVSAPKDRDFAFGLGPVVSTSDEIGDQVRVTVRVDGEERASTTGDARCEGMRELAAAGTVLRPGDLLVTRPLAVVEHVPPGAEVELELSGIGVLRQRVR
jgi:Fumarylacetoacetate (FAA) hydrolase family